ncbi:MAG: hypothetical protein ACPG4T_15750, partial [Nannocystaceae bacterium]
SALGFGPASSLRVGAAKAYPFGKILPTHSKIVPGSGDLPDDFFATARAAFESSKDRHKEGEEWLVSISGDAT